MMSTELTKYQNSHSREKAEVLARRQVIMNSAKFSEHRGMRCLGETINGENQVSQGVDQLLSS